jgi:UrcA family protein
MNTNVQTINKAAILAYAAATLLACVLVASRASADEQLRSETVKFQDLNLSTPAGAEALYNRIHAAARHVCADPFGWQPTVIACVKKAEGTAIGKVNQPLLTSYYRTKTGDRTGPLTANR